MKAMVLNSIVDLEKQLNPLQLAELPMPDPKENEVLIKISVCGVCHTELDEIEGRTPPAYFPIILGHQVVGEIVELSPTVDSLRIGDRVGVAWIFSSCGNCKFCQSGLENLCDAFVATGRDVHGGYAEYMTAHHQFVHPIPVNLSDMDAAPLLCAGAIGYRSLKLTGLENGQNLGLTGFGASAHLVMKMVRYEFPDTKVFVFARNEKERVFAKELGAVWSGDTTDMAPEKLNAIIDTTPVWKPIVMALENLEKGGRLIINSIRKESKDLNYLQQLSYPDHLWMEKEIKSVANVTREDVRAFLSLASKIPINPFVQEYALEDANKALLELKQGKIKGAKVLKINQ
ncbi:zinc-dependent alcohol dehydrogenase family protein [Fulvivirgaceae bacterium BMA10]|uniref:Zinc-dependent alcohol dehydrogenase family protein n=1 Tax=Splendidivirga corallicola TaxID=3051826 RepID=A0ABT8KT27_9BACT|nr:zinc-dependent alcohol dehydrogenase family protein [Fulvivirgaceae bacterium BMA10]